MAGESGRSVEGDDVMWTLHQGDCLDVLRTLPDNRFDSVITDPPYELGFMGKQWDNTGIAYSVELWEEVLRVLKPGGYLLSFGGTRTYHRMACAIEDAGFEIRDQMQWIYGSGFPKSMDISKQLDKRAKIKRPLSNTQRPIGGKQGVYEGQGGNWGETSNIPITPEAQQWDGWGTALKPANEPIVVARKPLSEKTVADNVLKWGTGGININDCRVGTQEKLHGGSGGLLSHVRDSKEYPEENGYRQAEQGRFPANIIFNEEAAAMLDEQSGERKAGGKVKGHEPSRTGQNGIYGTYGRVENKPFADTGGASRFFYCAKASKAERCNSKHPTVKPLTLMRYLCRLVTPPNGKILDPFAGSGTTMQAAVLEGFSVDGIELIKEYWPDILKRMATIEPSLFERGQA